MTEKAACPTYPLLRSSEKPWMKSHGHPFPADGVVDGCTGKMWLSSI